MRRYVVVGGGIAGLSAAEAIRAAEPSAEITLIGAEPAHFYSRPGLAYLIAGAIPERQLTIRSRAELRELALDHVAGEATALDARAHTITLRSGRTLAYDRLLVATGARSLRPDFAGADLDGVLTLDGLEDARHLIGAARRARHAIVVGGGPTAFELAEGLNARGVEVTYLLRGARYWAGVLDPVESRVAEDALAGGGVSIRHHTRVVRAVGRKGRLEAVETEDGRGLPCDILAVAIGVAPRTELARAAGAAVGRGVLVDARLRTSLDDVFAAGDVAELADVGRAGSRLDALWSSALAEGTWAGRSMAGATEPYRPPPSLNVTRLAGVTTTVVGAVGTHAHADDGDVLTITRGDSEGWRARPWTRAFEEHGPVFRARVLVAGPRAVGAVVMGDAAASRALSCLVRRQVDLSPLAAELAADPGHAVARLVELGARAEEPGAAGT